MVCKRDYFNPDNTWYTEIIPFGEKVEVTKVFDSFWELHRLDGDTFAIPSSDLDTHFIRLEEWRDNNIDKIIE